MSPEKLYRRKGYWAKVTRIAQGEYSIARGCEGEDMARYWEVRKITKRNANSIAFQWVTRTGLYKEDEGCA